METIETGLQIKTVTVSGRALRVGIRPGNPDKTPLLFFNGIGANIELLAHFVESLDDVEVIIFDIPGTGESPAPVLPYSMAEMVVLTANLLDKLGYHNQLDVMGLSWGGSMAQEFVHLYPERCRCLILAAATSGVTMVPGALPVLGKMLSVRRYIDPEYMIEIGGELYGGALRDNPELIRNHVSKVKKPAIRGYLYQLLAIMNWSSLVWLKDIKQPTMVIHGTDDPIVPFENACFAAKRIPNASLHVVDDGHLFLISRPAEIAKAVCKFLSN